MLSVYFVSSLLWPWCIYASPNARTGRPCRHRRFVVIQANIWVMVLLIWFRASWREWGEKVWTIVCRQRRGDDRQRMRKLVCWVGRCIDYRMNRRGPRTEPRGTLQVRVWGLDVQPVVGYSQWKRVRKGTTWSMTGRFRDFKHRR